MMFEFLFKKQFDELNFTKTEVESLRSRVLQLEKDHHELIKSVEYDKNVDRHLHELNSSEIKGLTQKIEDLKKLLQNEPKKKKVGRPKKIKEEVNE